MSEEHHAARSALLSIGTRSLGLAFVVGVIGAAAASAVALGGLALGAFAIRKFIVHRSRNPKAHVLHVSELTVDRLIVKDSTSRN